jgi:hypothetical protein
MGDGQLIPNVPKGGRAVNAAMKVSVVEKG